MSMSMYTHLLVEIKLASRLLKNFWIFSYPETHNTSAIKPTVSNFAITDQLRKGDFDIWSLNFCLAFSRKCTRGTGGGRGAARFAGRRGHIFSKSYVLSKFSQLQTHQSGLIRISFSFERCINQIDHRFRHPILLRLCDSRFTKRLGQSNFMVTLSQIRFDTLVLLDIKIHFFSNLQNNS